jgi:Transposase DDE domain
LLALVAGQDVEPAEGSDGRDGRWRIARRVAPERVISTVDPEARHTRKSPSSRRDGYRAHLVAEPDTGLITDEQLTKAAGSDNADAAIAQKFLAHTEPPADIAPAGESRDHESRDHESRDDAPDRDASCGGPADSGPPAGDPATGEAADEVPGGEAADEAADEVPGGEAADEDEVRRSSGNEKLVWYADSAYGTGEFREAIERAQHRAVIKPKPVQPAVEGGFTCDDFTIDERNGTVVCPAGQTRPLSPSRTATFGALCRDCPLRAQCTTAKSGRTITLHERDDLLRAARADWAADPALREDYRQQRPNVERTVAQVATRGGRRVKLRYRGTTKNNAWLKRRTGALNLRTLVGRGLTRVNGAWALAT